nr:flippase-like domain-containing protein [Nitrospirota bacterium]
MSAACLWYAFRGVNLSAMAAGIGQVGFVWVLASVAGAVFGLIIRAVRWRFLVAGGETVGSWSLISATFIGIMANNLLPARLGEVVRAWVLARRERTPVPTVLASIVVERLLDVFTALAFLGLALAVSSDLNGEAAGVLKRSGQVVLASVAVMTALLLILLAFRKRFLSVAETWTTRNGTPWASRGLELVKRFMEGLCGLRGGFHVAIVAGLSLLVWGVAIASFYVMARGFHLGVTPAQTTLVFLVVLLGVAIPSAPGFVGTFHGFCVAGLAMVAGTEPTVAAAYATLLHGSHWLAINAVGIGCLLADRSVTWTGITGLIRQT